jgi:hypothetical protein
LVVVLGPVQAELEKLMPERFWLEHVSMELWPPPGTQKPGGAALTAKKLEHCAFVNKVTLAYDAGILAADVVQSFLE